VKEIIAAIHYLQNTEFISDAEKRSIHSRRKIVWAATPLTELRYNCDRPRARKKDMEYRIRQFASNAMILGSAARSLVFEAKEAVESKKRDVELGAQTMSLSRHIKYVICSQLSAHEALKGCRPLHGIVTFLWNRTGRESLERLPRRISDYLD